MLRLPFQDRHEAGRLLGAQLATRKLPADAIVLALPRGGVTVGAAVADALQATLDVLVVRKLGVPGQPELAMGAIAGDTRVLDPQTIWELGISDDEIEEVAARESRELERRQKLYRGNRPAPCLDGRTVVLVDDGLATGSTMVAAARHVRAARPRELIVAVPVGSKQGCNRLRSEADSCICLASPEPFSSVGQWYTDFRQVTDGEVREMLARPAERIH